MPQILPRGPVVQNEAGPPSPRSREVGSNDIDLHLGSRQETVMCPPKGQPQGSHPHVTLPGPQR